MTHARQRFFRRTVPQYKKIYGHKKAKLLRGLMELAFSICPKMQRGKFGKLLNAINEVLRKAKNANQESYIPTNDILKLIVGNIRSYQSEFKYETSKYDPINRKNRQELHIKSIKDYIAFINSDRANHHHVPRMLIAVLYRYKQLIGGIAFVDPGQEIEFNLYFSEVSFERNKYVNYKVILESTVQDTIFENDPSSVTNPLLPFICGMSEHELVKQLDEIEKIPSYPNKQHDLQENFTYLLWHEMDMRLCVEYCTAAMVHPACQFMKASLEVYGLTCNEIWLAEQTIIDVQKCLEELIALSDKHKISSMNKMYVELCKKKNKLSDVKLKLGRMYHRISHKKMMTEEMLDSMMRDIHELYMSLRAKSQGLLTLFFKINNNYNTMYTVHDIESAERMILNHAQQDVDHALGRLKPLTLSKLSSYFINQDIIDRINVITDNQQQASHANLLLKRTTQ